MNTAAESNHLTRREAMLNVLKGAVTAAVVATVLVKAAPSVPTLAPDPEFVPENDYPFFGCEPESLT